MYDHLHDQMYDNLEFLENNATSLNWIASIRLQTSN